MKETIPDNLNNEDISDLNYLFVAKGDTGTSNHYWM